MNKMRLLVYAFVTVIVIGACKNAGNSISCSYDELLIGQWAHSESSKNGGCIDTLSFKQDKTFEWIFYNEMSGVFGHKDTTKFYGTWRTSNDTIYMLHNTHIPIIQKTELCYIIRLLNSDSLHWDMGRHIREMSRVK